MSAIPIPELFQRDDEDDELEVPICYVNVKKSVQGRWEVIPRQYTIEELSTPQQLHAALGAGSYELFGRDERNARLVRRQKVTIARAPGERDEPAQPVQPAMPMQTAQVGGGGDVMVQMLLAMMQNMAAMNQQTMQLVLAILNMGSSNSDKHTQQMAQLFTTFGQAQTQTLQAVMSQTAKADPGEYFLKAFEMVNEIRAGANEQRVEESGAAGDDLGTTIEAISKGVDVFSKLKGMAGGPETSPATAET